MLVINQSHRIWRLFAAVSASVAIIIGCTPSGTAAATHLRPQTACMDTAANVRSAAAWHVRFFRQTLDVRAGKINTTSEQEEMRNTPASDRVIVEAPAYLGIGAGVVPPAVWVARRFRKAEQNSCELQVTVYVGQEAYTETFVLLQQPEPDLIGTMPAVFRVTLSQFAEP